MRVEINLLPHREARRAADIRETIALLVLGLIVVGGGVFLTSSNLSSDVEHAHATVAQLEADIERYKPQQALIDKFKTRKQHLQDKLDVIDSLERARNGPVRVLDEVASRAPNRLWLTQISIKGTEIRMKGKSLDTGVVADFLRSLNESVFFKNVDLEKTEGGELVKGVRLVNFELRADMKAPASEKKKSKKSDKAAETARLEARGNAPAQAS